MAAIKMAVVILLLSVLAESMFIGRQPEYKLEKREVAAGKLHDCCDVVMGVGAQSTLGG